MSGLTEVLSKDLKIKLPSGIIISGPSSSGIFLLYCIVNIVIKGKVRFY